MPLAEKLQLVQGVAVVFMVLVVTAGQVYVWWISRSAHKDRVATEQALRDFRANGLPPEALAKMNAFVMDRIGLNLDLCERIYTDLAFMHDQVYDAAHTKARACPVCKTTLPQVERLLQTLRTMRVEIANQIDDTRG